MQAHLDDCCLGPGDKQDKDFHELLDANFKAHAHYASFDTDKTLTRGTFVIKHYAGDVTYTVDGVFTLPLCDWKSNSICLCACVCMICRIVWFGVRDASATCSFSLVLHRMYIRDGDEICAAGFIDKNNDLLFRDLKKAMISSSNAIVTAVFSAEELESKKRPLTAGTQFRKSMNELMDTLMAKSPSYIRCIKCVGGGDGGVGGLCAHDLCIYRPLDGLVCEVVPFCREQSRRRSNRVPPPQAQLREEAGRVGRSYGVTPGQVPRAHGEPAGRTRGILLPPSIRALPRALQEPLPRHVARVDRRRQERSRDVGE